MQNKQKFLLFICITFLIAGIVLIFLPGHLAKKSFVEAQSKLEQAEKQYSEITAKFEKIDWLKKNYVKSISTLLEKAHENIVKSKSELNIANSSGTDEKRSHSKVAIELLNNGKNSALSFLKNAVDELAFQEEAKQKAGPVVAQAREDLNVAKNHIVSVKKTFSLDKALKKTVEKEAKVNSLQEKTEKAIKTKDEDGKLDFALVYRSSLEVSNLSKEIVQDADEQVRFLTELPKNIAHLKLNLTVAKNKVRESDVYYDILNRYHQRQSWQGVATNADSSRTIINTVQKAISSAESLFNEQELSEANVACKVAQKNLNDINQLILTLKNYTENLERYRGEWSNARRDAQNTLDEEESKIREYGSYDSSAKSDYENAKDFLKIALGFAERRDYESAVKKAREAEHLADGTGEEAYEAYEDSQRRSRSNYSSNDDDDSPGIGGGFSGSSGGSDGGGWE